MPINKISKGLILSDISPRWFFNAKSLWLYMAIYEIFLLISMKLTNFEKYLETLCQKKNQFVILHLYYMRFQ